MRRSGTPAASRGVAERWRSGWTDARCGIPLALSAARKASCTRFRGMGTVAVAMPRPLRPRAVRGPCAATPMDEQPGTITSGHLEGDPCWPSEAARGERGQADARAEELQVGQHGAHVF